MLPNLVVIGGAKCGTTSLHHYLGLHPEIFMSHPKELDFFIEEENWNKGIRWYESKFEAPGKVIRGESSPRYTRYPIYHGIPRRMHSVIPHAKLIYLLRDPMDRLISQIIDDFSTFDRYQDLAVALLPLDASPLVAPSLQCLQLERFFTYYDPSQILLIDAKDLADRRSETMANIFRFLGVKDSFTSTDFALMLNPRSVKRKRTTAYLMIKKLLGLRPGRMLPGRLGLPLHLWLMRVSAPTLEPPVINRELEVQLLDAFHEDATRLRRLTGLNLEHWCV